MLKKPLSWLKINAVGRRSRNRDVARMLHTIEDDLGLERCGRRGTE
jgi:hypothetical protein